MGEGLQNHDLCRDHRDQELGKGSRVFLYSRGSRENFGWYQVCVCVVSTGARKGELRLRTVF